MVQTNLNFSIVFLLQYKDDFNIICFLLLCFLLPGSVSSTAELDQDWVIFTIISSTLSLVSVYIAANLYLSSNISITSLGKPWKKYPVQLGTLSQQGGGRLTFIVGFRNFAWGYKSQKNKILGKKKRGDPQSPPGGWFFWVFSPRKNKKCKDPLKQV